MREGKRKGLICDLRKELPLFVCFSLFLFVALLARPYAVAFAHERDGPEVVICAHGGPIAGKAAGGNGDGSGHADCPHCFLCRGHTISEAALPPPSSQEPLVPEYDASSVRRIADAAEPDAPFLLRPPSRAPPLIARVPAPSAL